MTESSTNHLRHVGNSTVQQLHLGSSKSAMHNLHSHSQHTLTNRGTPKYQQHHSMKFKPLMTKTGTASSYKAD